MANIKILDENTLKFKNKKYKCVVGENGFIDKQIKQEGDLKTPIGTYKILYYFYRKDRIKEPKTILKGHEITNNCAWCDDIKSPFYNQYCKLPCEFSHENLKREDNRYDIIVVLSHNTNPIEVGKGSAVFFHLASDNYTKTQGCVAVSLQDMLNILENLTENTEFEINPS